MNIHHFRAIIKEIEKPLEGAAYSIAVMLKSGVELGGVWSWIRNTPGELITLANDDDKVMYVALEEIAVIAKAE